MLNNLILEGGEKDTVTGTLKLRREGKKLTAWQERSRNQDNIPCSSRREDQGKSGANRRAKRRRSPGVKKEGFFSLQEEEGWLRAETKGARSFLTEKGEKTFWENRKGDRKGREISTLEGKCYYSIGVPKKGGIDLPCHLTGKGPGQEGELRLGEGPTLYGREGGLFLPWKSRSGWGTRDIGKKGGLLRTRGRFPPEKGNSIAAL